MSRPRSFNDQRVRERVTDAFVAHGYTGTSLAMLTEASGLGKQSLYNAFGDKRALYLQSLDCVGSRMAGLRESMSATPTGLQAVHVLFEHLLTACSDPDPAVHTCIVSAGLMEGLDVKPIADHLRQKWHESQSLLQAAVERGQRDGSIMQQRPAPQLAALLMTLMSGLRVTARALEDPHQLKALAQLGLKFLEHAD